MDFANEFRITMAPAEKEAVIKFIKEWEKVCENCNSCDKCLVYEYCGIDNMKPTITLLKNLKNKIIAIGE